MILKNTLIALAATIAIAGCSSDDDDSSSGTDQNASSCASVEAGSGNIIVTNTCDRSINFRELANEVIVTIDPQVTIEYQNVNNFVIYAACFTPYNPIPQGSGTFSCER